MASLAAAPLERLYNMCNFWRALRVHATGAELQGQRLSRLFSGRMSVFLPARGSVAFPFPVFSLFVALISRSVGPTQGGRAGAPYAGSRDVARALVRLLSSSPSPGHPHGRGKLSTCTQGVPGTLIRETLIECNPDLQPMIFFHAFLFEGSRLN